MQLGFRRAAAVSAVSGATLKTAVDMGKVDPSPRPCRAQRHRSQFRFALVRSEPRRFEKRSAWRPMFPSSASWPASCRVERARPRSRRDGSCAQGGAPCARCIRGSGRPHRSESPAFAKRLNEDIARLGLGEHVKMAGPRSDVPDFSPRSTSSRCRLTTIRVHSHSWKLWPRERRSSAKKQGGTPEINSVDGESSLLVPPMIPRHWPMHSFRG